MTDKDYEDLRKDIPEETLAKINLKASEFKWGDMMSAMNIGWAAAFVIQSIFSSNPNYFLAVVFLLLGVISVYSVRRNLRYKAINEFLNVLLAYRYGKVAGLRSAHDEFLEVMKDVPVNLGNKK